MEPTTPTSTPTHRQIRLLIVDDNLQVRQDLHQLLTLSGELEVVGEAGSGQEAIDLTDLIHPDVILMDLAMPEMDGYAATRQIKANLPQCRVIALSVHSYPLARQKASQAGMDGFIEKGTPLPEILHTLQQIWNKDQS